MQRVFIGKKRAKLAIFWGWIGENLPFLDNEFMEVARTKRDLKRFYFLVCDLAKFGSFIFIDRKQGSFLQFYDFESFAKFSKILTIIFKFNLFKISQKEIWSPQFESSPPQKKTLTGRCRKSAYHLYEDLAKSGYKPNMKYKSLIILLYFFGCTLKTKYRNLVIYTIFSLTLADWEPPKSHNFLIFNYKFLLLAKFRQ